LLHPTVFKCIVAFSVLTLGRSHEKNLTHCAMTPGGNSRRAFCFLAAISALLPRSADSTQKLLAGPNENWSPLQVIMLANMPMAILIGESNSFDGLFHTLRIFVKRTRKHDFSRATLKLARGKPGADRRPQDCGAAVAPPHLACKQAGLGAPTRRLCKLVGPASGRLRPT